jgi:hypothetical protein
MSDSSTKLMPSSMLIKALDNASANIVAFDPRLIACSQQFSIEQSLELKSRIILTKKNRSAAQICPVDYFSCG